MTFEELTLDLFKMKLYLKGVFANFPLLHSLCFYGRRYAIHEKMTYGTYSEYSRVMPSPLHDAMELIVTVFLNHKTDQSGFFF